MQRSSQRLAEGLVRGGARVTILTTEPVTTSRLFPRVERAPGKPTIVRFPWPTGWHYTLAELAFYARAALWLLLHAQEWRTLQGVYAPTCGALAVLAGLLLHRRSVVRLASAGPPGDMATVARHPARSAIEALLRRADVIVCPGREIVGEVAAIGVSRARILHLPNGVDAEVFRPAAPPVTVERVLAATRFGKGKNLDLLLEAWALVERARPLATLAIAGDGPEAPRLRERIRALELRRVELLGVRADMPELYRSAAVFVLPSTAEGLANALLEAMASGLACVATDIDANREALGDTGVLVAPEAEKLAAALATLLADPTRAQALGRAARARIQEVFALETMVARYARLHSR